MSYEEQQKNKAENLAKATNKPIFEELPPGWERLPTGTMTTAPAGYYWASNKKSFFDKDYQSALIKDNNYFELLKDLEKKVF